VSAGAIRGASVLERFDEFLGRAVSMRAPALLRVLAGPVVLLPLQPFLSDAQHRRIYRDAFFEPHAPGARSCPGRSTSGCSGLRRWPRLPCRSAFSRGWRMTNRGFHTGAAKLVVLTELFVAVGLWWRGTRYAAVWVAVLFHATIQVSASVEVFSLLGIAVLVIWAVPTTRDRVLRVDPTDARQRRRAAVVRRLDWLARFRVEPTAAGSPLEVVDRDGTAIRGVPAGALTLSRLALAAWFALPALLLPAVVRARHGRKPAMVAVGS
jgi:hypothetical protein